MKYWSVEIRFETVAACRRKRTYFVFAMTNIYELWALLVYFTLAAASGYEDNRVNGDGEGGFCFSGLRLWVKIAQENREICTSIYLPDLQIFILIIFSHMKEMTYHKVVLTRLNEDFFI